MNVVGEKTAVLGAVDGALKLSAPFLATDPGRLSGQLTGRLVGSPEPEIDRLLDNVREHAPRPWLCPLSPVLTQAGGSAERILAGHAGEVHAVAITPDGARIVSGNADTTLLVWNIESGRPERLLEGHTSPISGVAISPDGARIVSASWDKTVRIWNLERGRSERT
jgi:WD40 repeat protein